ncbi:lanthionine synthetase LanC family protein [Liquorilactobacillus hordei]|uniref:Uncharacterized protein n=1 Tax=Liquorilactobacillus hordei DSM 19519 TaxID=1423759 RepID=A0A0R1MLQ6_9LACO|nr:lanthionine synthetase LanC family protein [Liquorilactobacillus hordei]KRL06122.1 hypothetical protein FC92_GL001130 [Liquorilactobacillus hordei DSM 19519]QYH53024.1 hypothetical protein G6O70_11825 [Liquorilactobacillus hordei DSM 19519]
MSWARKLEKHNNKFLYIKFTVSLLDEIKKDISSLYSGYGFGLAGIGTELLQNLQDEQDKTLYNQEINLVEQIATELKKRTYYINNEIKFDYGSPLGFIQNEDVNNFRYGNSGIGHFFCKYYDQFHDTSILRLITQLQHKVLNSLSIVNANQLVFKDFEGEATQLSGLALGYGGPLIFLFESSKFIINPANLTNLSNILQISEKKRDLVCAKLSTGVAGQILQHHILGNNKLVVKYQTILLNLKSENSDVPFWTPQNKYFSYDDDFFEGNSGIVYSLIM